MTFVDNLRWEEYKQLFSAKLDGFAESNGLVKMMAERTKLPEKVFVRYITTGLVMVLLLLSFQKLFSSMFCIVIPMYMSIKALAHDDAKASKSCLNYWVLYAGFSTLEVLLYPLIYFIPLWSMCKSMIMFWLYSPVTDGGAKIMAIVTPVFNGMIEYRIDAVIRNIPGLQKLIGKDKEEITQVSQ